MITGEVVLQRSPPPFPPSPILGVPPNFPNSQPDITPPLPQSRPAQRPTVYSEVQLRPRNALSESSSPGPIRRHSEQPPSTLRHRPNSPDFLPARPTNYTEVEIRPRAVSPSRYPPSARQQPGTLPARRISEQPHHLPRPKSANLDDFSVNKVEPVLPPRTDKDQLRPSSKPVKADRTKKKKKKSQAQRPRSGHFPPEVAPTDLRGPVLPPAENPYLPERPGRVSVGYPQKTGISNGAVPPPLAPRRV